jgi:hypothetical protein
MDICARIEKIEREELHWLLAKDPQYLYYSFMRGEYGSKS